MPLAITDASVLALGYLQTPFLSGEGGLGGNGGRKRQRRSNPIGRCVRTFIMYVASGK